MKRRIRQTVWDNWFGYLGTRNVHLFGTDQAAAEHWLATGELPAFDRAENLQALGEMATFRQLAAAGKWDWDRNAPKKA